MENKVNITNIDIFNNFSNKEKYANTSQNFIKSGIKKYNNKSNTIITKKTDENNMININESKKKPKQIKQCFYDLIKVKKQKEKMKKEYIKIINTDDSDQKIKLTTNKEKSRKELRNKYSSKTKNIKVTKIKIEKVNKDNCVKINSNTNRNFYQKPFRNYNLVTEDSINSFNYLSDMINNDKNLRSLNLISVKSFNRNNKENDLLFGHVMNSEYINFMNPFNKEINDLALCNKNNNKYNISSNTYSNTTTGKSKSKLSSNSSKNILTFKNIKTIYAHFEIFISLYLKRIFKYFIEKLTNYKIKKDIYNNSLQDNNFKSIINIKHSKCPLFYYINSYQDKLCNKNYINNNLIPLLKGNELLNNKNINKDEVINNKSNKICFNSENDIDLSNNKGNEIIKHKSVYIPKKKVPRCKTDFFKGMKNIKSTINSKAVNNNKNIKSSPIKEMNINLKQINVCRLNDLNQLYQNQKLCKSNSGNFYFSEINPIIKINNNINNRPTYNCINLYSINNDSYNNTSKEKNKIKKIQSTKNSIYIKPKEKSEKKRIKEIKIHNNLSPLKKHLTYYRRNNILKSDNLANNTYYNSKYLNNLSKTKDKNLFTISNNNKNNSIKKIYINRNSKYKNLNNTNSKENIFDSYKKELYSTYLNFKDEDKKNITINNTIKHEIISNQYITEDKRVFINIKYMNYFNNKYVKRQKSIYDISKLKANHQCSIAIINNNIQLNKELYNNILLYKLNNNKNIKILDIYSFDNNGNENKDNIKNITFSFKEYTLSKEENKDNKYINDHLVNFLSVLKYIIIKNIRNYIYKYYKKKSCLLKLLFIKNKKLMNFYFLKLKNNQNNIKIKNDKNNYGVYHKINYNDDFNLNKKLKSPKNNKKNIDFNNTHYKTKQYYLTSHKSIKQIQYINKIGDKKRMKEISSNAKYMNKEINIFVHNNNEFE